MMYCQTNLRCERNIPLASIKWLAYALMLMLATLTLPSFAHDQSASKNNSMAAKLQVENPWARATFALAKTGAAYFSAINTGDTPIMLSTVSVTEDVAMNAEMHHIVMQNDMMQMQQLAQGISINAGQRVEFQPSGKHIMMMGLKGPLIKGQSVTLTFHFADNSQKVLVFNIIDKR